MSKHASKVVGGTFTQDGGSTNKGVSRYLSSASPPAPGHADWHDGTREAKTDGPIAVAFYFTPLNTHEERS